MSLCSRGVRRELDSGGQDWTFPSAGRRRGQFTIAGYQDRLLHTGTESTCTIQQTRELSGAASASAGRREMSELKVFISANLGLCLRASVFSDIPA